MDFLSELFSLKDRTAVIIGGGGVLGRKMAEGLALAGAGIALIDPNCGKAVQALNKVLPDESRMLAIEADATSEEAIEGAMNEIQDFFGRLDVLVNAPGINSSTPFFDITEEEWRRILDINLKSMFLACRVFGRLLLGQKKGGSIINISSASSGPPLSRVFTYGISKAGVNNLTQYLAGEWARYGIRVNAIAPGFFPARQNRKILTPERTKSILQHTPMGRFGNPDELAGAVIWLASEKASSFVTGAIIRVDGGFTAKTI